MQCNQRIKPDNGRSPCVSYIRPIDDTEPGFCVKPTQFRCIEACNHKLPRISYSAIEDWVKCRRFFWLSRIKGIEPKPDQLPSPLKLGKIWDRFISHQYDHLGQRYDLPEDIYIDDRQAAILTSLMRAYKDLEINSDYKTPDNGAICQREFHLSNFDSQFIGYIDRWYEDYIIEVKLSGNPSWYEKLFNIHDQAGTYLLAEEKAEYVSYEITRLPAPSSSKQFESETLIELEERVYRDIVYRPSHYFLGYDKKTHTFGRRYYRSEFNYPELINFYRYQIEDMHDAMKRDRFWKNKRSCYNLSPCWFLPICTTGVVSEELYQTKEKKGIKREETK
jgi:hypothetical protein